MPGVLLFYLLLLTMLPNSVIVIGPFRASDSSIVSFLLVVNKFSKFSLSMHFSSLQEKRLA